MGIIALQANIEQEQAGEIRGLELIAIRYTGPRSSIAPRGAMNKQGKWPGTAPINRGNWYFGLVPDEGLAYYETHQHLDLVFADDREAFAKVLLEQRRLPENVFGQGADRDLQERVYDPLGLEPAVQAGPVDTQLQNIAGVDEEDLETDGEEETDDRVVTLVESHSRKQLKEAVKVVREDAEEFSLQGSPGPTELAEFLATKDEATVHDAFASLDDSEDGEE